MQKRILALILVCLSAPAFAQMVEVQEERVQPPKEKAGEYMKAKQQDKPAAAPAARGSSEGAPRFLALHIGSFFSDQAYRWGDRNQPDVAKLDAGVDYRMGEWINSMDWSMRINYTSYKLDKDSSETGVACRKLSFGAILTFPDVASGFPLYFGGGLGAGFFIKQLEDESPIALDYSLLLGARFHDVIGRTGFMIETGLKNHFLLASDGQFNGVYVNVGTVFSF